MPDRAMRSLLADPDFQSTLAATLGVPDDWVGPPEAGAFGADVFHVRVTPRPATSEPAPMYLLALTTRLGLTGADDLLGAVKREAARLRGELELDGHLWSVPCGPNRREHDLLAEAQHHLRAAGGALPADGDTLLLLGQLLGQAIDAHRNGNPHQAYQELVQLAGYALAAAGGRRG